jgi:hypothetical protein
MRQYWLDGLVDMRFQIGVDAKELSFLVRLGLNSISIKRVGY